MTLFFSRRVKKIFSWIRGSWWFIKCKSAAARLWASKKQIKEHKINTCDSWRYKEVLWSESIDLCKKLNIIYDIITCNPEPQTKEESDSFQWTGSFGLIQWAGSNNRFTSLCNYAMMSYISNHFIKAPNNDVKLGCLNKLVLINSAFYITMRNHKIFNFAP